MIQIIKVFQKLECSWAQPSMMWGLWEVPGSQVITWWIRINGSAQIWTHSLMGYQKAVVANVIILVELRVI